MEDLACGPPPYQAVEHSFRNSPPPPYSSTEGERWMEVENPSKWSPGFPLSYLDFFPLNPKQRYTDLVESVNVWLAANRQFKIHSCESVSFITSADGLPVTLSSFNRRAKDMKSFMRALRLWVVRRTDQSEASEVLCTLTRVPDRCSIFEVQPGNVAHGLSLVCGGSLFPRFSKCLDSLNTDLEEKPILGRVLKMETVQVLANKRNQVDPDEVFWTEPEGGHTYCNTLRVFYVEGSLAQVRLGWKDFAPDYLRASPPEAPRFESYSKILSAASCWTKQQNDVRIVNVQTLETKIATGTMASEAPNVDTDRVEFHDSHSGDFQFVKFLRVYYVTSGAIYAARPYSLIYRPFLPNQNSFQQYESPVQILLKLGNWIQFNAMIYRDKGIAFEDNILCAETARYEARPNGGLAVDVEQTTRKYHPHTADAFVYGIRLFLNSAFYEPPVGYIDDATMKRQIDRQRPAREACCFL